MADPYKRYYRIAGITIQVESDLPILDTTFSPAIREFEVQEPGDDVIVLKHHFSEKAPQIDVRAKEVYRRQPWTIYQTNDSWYYKQSSFYDTTYTPEIVAVFHDNYSYGDIYHHTSEKYLKGRLDAITLFHDDQVFLTQILPQRSGVILHSSGAIINGNGILFVGHSSYGKTTIIRKLQKTNTSSLEVLNDDRIIVRYMNENLSIFGTWKHQNNTSLSNSTAPLKMVCFISKSSENSLTRLFENKQIRNQLLSHTIRAYSTEAWWDFTLPLLVRISSNIPAYSLKSDRSNRIVNEIMNSINNTI